jgi:hypothetical protein
MIDSERGWQLRYPSSGMVPIRHLLRNRVYTDVALAPVVFTVDGGEQAAPPAKHLAARLRSVFYKAVRAWRRVNRGRKNSQRGRSLVIRRQLIGAAMALLGGATALAADAVETKWDITNTGQPSRDIEFTVTEGTWMGVDVSPDGKTLMFDLLGDIYSLPAAGGDAALVHGGPALQTAMSFSPDGSQLLYLSDASGVANVWLSNLDGSSPRQITREKTDILSSPAWAPDGRSVAVTHSSSLQPEMYSSQIRWFDIAGGSGRVLVDTPKNRRDVQEARLSGDGRFLYYTERLSNPFVYVDANHINYAIKRRDLSNGATESLLQGFGGATTPQISPDGRHVAFIRRVKTRTVLFVHDLQTGRQRPVFDGLDRDAQAETWLQTGYFPRFDWFPDNRHVAIWGKGKLLRVDTGVAAEAGAAAQEIPFRVRTRHRVTEPLRFANELVPERFPVRVVRQLAPSPDGRNLVF